MPRASSAASKALHTARMSLVERGHGSQQIVVELPVLPVFAMHGRPVVHQRTLQLGEHIAPVACGDRHWRYGTNVPLDDALADQYFRRLRRLALRGDRASAFSD
jgi:hypothetical protein